MARMEAELEWLKGHPDFEERPATLAEFLTDDYLGVDAMTRESIKTALSEIFGPEVTDERIALFALAMITGGIGIGKTTIASIILPYLCHWVLCLKNPQEFFGLMPGSRIAFMQMSTSEKQALEVMFGDIKARIDHSKWFQKYPYDPSFKNQIRFDKDIWVIPGDSAETTFEGYNILGGILEEADSHKTTPTKDYAEQGFNTINNRISSRFGRVRRPTRRDGRGEPVEWAERSYGFLMVIGQMKSSTGFASKKFAEFGRRPDAYAKRMTIWESLGWHRFLNPDGSRDSFWHDKLRKRIVPRELVPLLETREHLIEVPKAYRTDFENNPERALKDLAGIPPAVGDPFISLVDKIHAARDRWIEHHPGLGSPVRRDGRIEPWFVCRDSLKRVAHIDIGYSPDGDALGIAMGHVREVVEIDGELKPYIVIDFLMRMHAPPGAEIFLGDMRRVIYHLRDERRFRIKKATLDGFESTDTMQQFQRRRIETEYVSVDRQKLPYEDLREAVYEDRIEFPPYIVEVRKDSGTEEVEILVSELEQLQDLGLKIDHPPGGSKDVADAVAGVAYTLMGDRSYRKTVVRMDSFRDKAGRSQPHGVGGIRHPAYLGDNGLRAPLPPTIGRTS